jgi:hypothetical protein
MSLDHDLGTNQTGYDLICWIEEQIHNGELEILPEFSVHSANSVGRRKMEAGLDKIKQLLKEKNET